MKKLFAALFALMFVVPAHAQKTRAQLNTEITTNFPDNTSGAITPAILRTTTSDFVLSWASLSDTNTFTSGQQIWNLTTTITSATAATLDDLKVQAATTTITGNVGSPITKLGKVSLYQPTFTDAAAVTVTNAATMMIDNAPLAAGSVTITKAWALMLNSGDLWLNAGHVLTGTLIPADWPAAGFETTVGISTDGAAGFAATPQVSATVGEQSGFLTSATIGSVANTWSSFRANDVAVSGSLVNQYGLHIFSPTHGSSINAAIAIKGTAPSGFGTENPQAQVHINANAATVAPLTGSLLYVQQLDGSNNVAEFDAYGTSVGYQMIARVATGTAASPARVGAGQFMFNMQAVGRDNVAYSAGSQGGFSIVSANQWSTTDHSTSVRFFTTPTGSTTQAEALRVQPSGGLSVSNVNDSGIGTVTLKAQAFASLTACAAGLEGAIADVNDSVTTTWGATITGGSTHHVLAFCNGTNWTVMGNG